MYDVTCPFCGHQAPLQDFEPSLCDECCCPRCDEMFLFEPGDDDGEDDDEDEWAERYAAERWAAMSETERWGEIRRLS